jgi:hypothetical protein
MQPVFTIKEFGDGQPFICMECYKADDGFPDQPFGFDLPPGTTMERAKEIRDFLKVNLTNVLALA